MESGRPSSTNHELSHQVSLDIDRLAQSVTEELEISNPFPDTWCIYKVPERLRELNKKAYTPRLVSIGPIHHGNDKLKAMEDHKRMYLKEFIARTKVSVKGFIELIKEKETRLRNCYAETNGFSSEYFIKMILMDAAFVIMLLLKWTYTDFRGSRDSIFYPPYKSVDVRVDICLLENQLPFFILEELCGLSPIFGNSPKATLIGLAHWFFSREWGSWAVGDILEKKEISGVKHLVDFLTIYHRPTEQQQCGELEVLTAPSVKELHQAGVKFVLSSSKYLLDIKFDRNKGRLEFPRLQLDDRTEIIIRNMQAFEQCHGLTHGYVGDYIFLMGLFVSASKDVEMLVENRIIENWLPSNEEVVQLFYNLNKQNSVWSGTFLFKGLVKDLNAFCERPWNKWKANLKQNYFNTPWAAVSVSGAVILLILTVIQSVCSILQKFQVFSSRVTGCNLEDHHLSSVTGMESGGPSSTNHELNHQVSLDIDRLREAPVKGELEIPYAFSTTCAIYKVPERLRELNEKAYTPRGVSIGPIHHGKEKLKAMEDHKRMYLREFLARTGVSEEAFIELIKKNEKGLRNCYAETIEFGSEYLINMILMDAAFVIVSLLRCKYTDFRESRDSIFHPPYKGVDVRVDICLLENQLPFFILEELCGLSPVFFLEPFF